MKNAAPLISFLIVAALFGALGLRAAEETRSAADLEILFWEKRLDKDPDDFITPLKLGAAYLQKTRESGDFLYLSKAEDALKKSLKIKPSNPDAMNWLASAHTMQHRFKDALELAGQTAKLLPNDGFAYGIMGDAHLELGNFELCEKNYVRALELAPEMFSYARWAGLKFMQGDISEALKFFNEALQDAERKNRAPANVAWCRLQLGYLHFRIGKFDQAEEHYQGALKTFPAGHLALEHLAELRGAQDKFDEAIALYEKALAASPRPELHQALGDLLVAAQKPDLAEAHYDKAVALYLAAVNAGNSHYFHHLAGFYSDSRRAPADALRWAKRDFETRQGVYALDCLAWAQYQNGEFKEAAENMKKALANGTKDAHIFYHASMIYFRAGDVAGSRANLKKAVETNPYHNKFHAHRN